MATPLLETKLHAPRSRQRLVERPRLEDHLSRAARAKLTLVSAPPGFGKTTLIADWLARGGTGPPAAWVSLDATDSDRVSFWRYVVAAMRAASPDLGDGPLAALESSPPQVDAAVQALLNELAALPGDLVLVLDDFHVVESRGVIEDLAFFLDHVPPSVHVVITTRADPALPLSRLRARGDLVEIRAADLRFTPDEAAAYLNESMELALTPDDVQALDARTEGWIAGLQLAALSVQGRDDASSFIASFAGDDRYIVDYLVDEVLARQSDAIRDFLLRTGILDRLTGSLCDAMTGRDDGTRDARSFATIVWSDDMDEGSDPPRPSELSRPGVYRLNIGVTRETFQRLVGEVVDADYAAFERFVPHPVYAAALGGDRQPETSDGPRPRASARHRRADEGRPG